MSRVATSLVVLTTAFALSLPANATTLTRTFVSAAGSDSNPCTISQPCATFAHAYSLTAANGVVAALDPGKYGPLTITTAVTINGNGWAAITAPAAGSGITINAGSGAVALIGLEIDGAGAGNNGIVFNSGGSLTITDCVAQNFINGSEIYSGNGILIEPSSGAVQVIITNTTVSNNQTSGIDLQPLPGSTATMNGIIDRVVATANFEGINVGTNAGGGATVFAISNSIVSGNSNSGLGAINGSASLTLSIDNVSFIGNQYGISANSTVELLLGRSVITGNSQYGIYNNLTVNTFYTYGDNRINLNAIDISTPLLTNFKPQ